MPPATVAIQNSRVTLVPGKFVAHDRTVPVAFAG
jgi:hypothetical protein